MEYNLTIQTATVKRNQVTAVHIIAAILLITIGVITLIFPFAVDIYKAGKVKNPTPYNYENYAGIIFIIVGFIILILSIFFNKKWLVNKKNALIRGIELFLFGVIIVYALLKTWYMPALYAGIAFLAILISYFLERMDQKQKALIINDSGITFKSAIKSTHWKWTMIEKGFLKYNVFTLIGTDQKMFQFIISNSENINISQMNDYALNEIDKAIPDRIKDNW